jgi:hypothetical protein
MSDNMPTKGDAPDRLDDLDDVDPIGETDDELVQLNVKARKWVRKKLGHKMVEEEKALQDVVDEALRLYVEKD